jgi:hypothetical protein
VPRYPSTTRPIRSTRCSSRHDGPTSAPLPPAKVTRWSFADPRKFPTMEIAAESPGNGSQHGTAVLDGTPRCSQAQLYGTSSKTSTWLGRTTLKCRRSSVITVPTFSRSATAMTLASGRAGQIGGGYAASGTGSGARGRKPGMHGPNVIAPAQATAAIPTCTRCPVRRSRPPAPALPGALPRHDRAVRAGDHRKPVNKPRLMV